MTTHDAAGALEPFRKYLAVLADLHLDRRLRGKLDPADLVRQTLLRACSAWPELRRREPEVLAAWLRRILARTLADAVPCSDPDGPAARRQGPGRSRGVRARGCPDAPRCPGPASRPTPESGATPIRAWGERYSRVELLSGRDQTPGIEGRHRDR